LERKLRDEIVGEVIDENTEERETPEKINPEVPLHSRRTARDAHNYFTVTSPDHHQHDGWFASAWDHNSVVLKSIHAFL
jgi:hypothetical protein